MNLVIPLNDVRNALMCARVRQIARTGSDGKPLGRCAAFTQYPLLNVTCSDRVRGHRPYPWQEHHFGPMSRGELERVLQRARWRGLAEVRRTWGAGLRVLQAEFSASVMR